MERTKEMWANLTVGNYDITFDNSSPARVNRLLLQGTRTAATIASSSAAAAKTVPKTVVRYAPLVFLHPRERYLPASASFFIANSSLRWAHYEAGDHSIEPKGSISAPKLGSGGYTHWKNGFLPRHNKKRTYNSRERTAPYRGITQLDGFFLDLAKDKRGGQGTHSPVYYQYVPKRYVIYWFFFAYNQKLLNHEGDWENITVHLDDRGRATAVAYYAHGGPRVYSWSKVRKYKKGTHPIVYSAIGSHASYPRPGKYRIKLLVHDFTARGAAWRTWNNLRNVQREPWYGFGGAWGEIGELAETSGPLGPGHKFPVPTGW